MIRTAITFRVPKRELQCADRADRIGSPHLRIAPGRCAGEFVDTHAEPRDWSGCTGSGYPEGFPPDVSRLRPRGGLIAIADQFAGALTLHDGDARDESGRQIERAGIVTCQTSTGILIGCAIGTVNDETAMSHDRDLRPLR